MKRRTTDELINDLNNMVPGAAVNYDRGYGWTVRTNNGTFYADTYAGIVRLIKEVKR